MATTAAGQAKLDQMIASGMGKQQALTMLINAQKKANTAAAPIDNSNNAVFGFKIDPNAANNFQSNWAASNGIADLTSGNSGAVDTYATAANQVVPWTLEGDPTYQAAMSAGQAQFNYARNAALGSKQNAETGLAQQRKQLDVNAAENRRRLAGNYASRGLAGGAAGALTLAEAQANAEQIASQTSIQDQLARLNQDYLANYGATGTDWTGTLVGQQYKTDAAQAALAAQLARYGTV